MYNPSNYRNPYSLYGDRGKQQTFPPRTVPVTQSQSQQQSQPQQPRPEQQKQQQQQQPSQPQQSRPEQQKQQQQQPSQPQQSRPEQQKQQQQQQQQREKPPTSEQRQPSLKIVTPQQSFNKPQTVPSKVEVKPKDETQQPSWLSTKVVPRWQSSRQNTELETPQLQPSKAEEKEEPFKSSVTTKTAEPPKAVVSFQASSTPGSSNAESREGKMIVPEKTAEQDNMAIVKVSEPPKSLQQGVKEDATKLAKKIGDLQAQGDSNVKDLGVRVITLAGDNKGATMDLGSRPNGGRNAVYEYNKTGNEESSDVANKGKGKQSGSLGGGAPVNAYVNSNVQAANNSILFNSTCPHRDPGVKLALSNTRESTSPKTRKSPKKNSTLPA